MPDFSSGDQPRRHYWHLVEVKIRRRQLARMRAREHAHQRMEHKEESCSWFRQIETLFHALGRGVLK